MVFPARLRRCKALTAQVGWAATGLKKPWAIAALVLLLSACGDEQPPEVMVEPAAVPVTAPPLSAPALPDVVPRAASKQSQAEPLPNLPAAPVDLSLPAQLIDDPAALESIAPIRPADTLLPPLFVEKPKPESSFQLNGRLLTNDQLSEDYLRSVEGAEIQLQYKH